MARALVLFLVLTATASQAAGEPPDSTSIRTSSDPANSGPVAPEPGWFLGGDVAAYVPILQGRRMPLPGFSPAALWRYPGLDVAGIEWPSFSTQDDTTTGVLGLNLLAGYRLEGGLGELLLGVRALDGDGQRFLRNGDPLSDAYLAALTQFGGSVGGIPVTRIALDYPEDGWPDPLGAALAGTRLTAFALDLAYGNGLYGLDIADIRWTAGGRFGLMESYDVLKSRGIESRTDTRFAGFGPAASLSVEWRLSPFAGGDTGAITLITRANGSLLYGRVRQIDRESTGDIYPATFQYATAEENHAVPTFGFDVALAIRSYRPSGCLMIGYRFETWKGVGRVGASDWDLILHGAFVGFQVNY